MTDVQTVTAMNKLKGPPAAKLAPIRRQMISKLSEKFERNKRIDEKSSTDGAGKSE